MREPNFEPEFELLDLRFYLKHGGIPFREEVFIFDFLDLVGNVGGFMGLFLGASLLSIMDDATEVFGRMLGRVKELKAKSGK